MPGLLQSSFEGLAEDGLEPFRCCSPRVSEIDLMVLTPPLVALFLYEAVDLFDVGAFFGVGADVHDLRRPALL